MPPLYTNPLCSHVPSFQYTGGVSCLTFLPAAPPPAHLWVSCRVISWCHRSLMFRPLSSTSPGGGGQWLVGTSPRHPLQLPSLGYTGVL